MDISKAVGTIRNSIACSINVIPLSPRIRGKAVTTMRSILCSAIDGTGKSTGLSGVMELEIEIEQVLESFTRDLAYGTLTDVGEHCIQKFTEYGRPDACGPVWGGVRLGLRRSGATHNRG